MLEILLGNGSYVLIVGVIILTGAGLPVPEEIPVIAAGILSAHGHLLPWVAAACCLFGALAGDCLMYAIGRHFGRGILRSRRWWTRFVTPEREAHAEQMFQQHGFKFLFLARFLVGLRGPTYVSAGILRLPFRRFLLIDSFCATVVVGIVFGLSYFYGQTITAWVRRAEVIATVVAVLALGGVALYLWRRRRARVSPPASPADPAILPAERPAPDKDRRERDEVGKVKQLA
jgi:membrane protein DedA with SNARE-associated domain